MPKEGANVNRIFSKFRIGLKSGQTGFTLVELLVVVAIIVGLAAAIIPNVGRFTGKGAEGATTAEMESVQASMDAMMAEAGITALTANNLGTTGTALQTFTGLPTATGGGAITLPDASTVDLTNYLRSATATYFYCWDTTGIVTEQFTTAVACTS